MWGGRRGEVETGFKFGSRETSLEATAPVQVRDKGSQWVALMSILALR